MNQGSYLRVALFFFVIGSFGNGSMVLAQGKGDPVNGAKVFEKAQCIGCHVNGGNILMRDKPIKGEQFLKEFPSDAMIAKLVRQGRPGSPMPVFKPSELSDKDLNDVIAYIRTLTPTKGASAAAQPAKSSAPARGQAKASPAAKQTKSAHK